MWATYRGSKGIPLVLCSGMIICLGPHTVLGIDLDLGQIYLLGKQLSYLLCYSTGLIFKFLDIYVRLKYA